MNSKHIYLISLDALRYDCISYANNKGYLEKNDVIKYLNTPTLDYITQHSMRFTNAFTAAPYTSASHASIFTGTYPPENNVRAFFNPASHKLNPQAKTIASVLKKEGYTTVFASDEVGLFETLDLTRGFDHIFEENDNDLINFIEKNQDRKLFVFKHFLDIHNPYLFTRFEYERGVNKDYKKLIKLLTDIDIKSGDNKRKYYKTWNKVFGKGRNPDNKLLELYIKGISKFDKGRFKNFIDSLKLNGEMDNSTFIFFADHGEGRTSPSNPNLFAHGGYLYDEVMRVPLFIYSKNLKPDIKKGLVSLIDIFKTILDMAKVDKNEKTERNKSNSLLSEKEHQFVYGEVWRSGVENPLYFPENEDWLLFQRMIRTKNHKYILQGKPEYFLERNAEISETAINRYISCVFDESERTDVSEGEVYMTLKTILERKDVLTAFMYDLRTDPDEKNPINLLTERAIFRKRNLNRLLSGVFNIDAKQPKSLLNSYKTKISLLSKIHNLLRHRKLDLSETADISI